MFASEYGWTPSYVLDELTGKQVRRMLAALEHRYEVQAEAMQREAGGKSSTSGHDDPNTLVFDENLSDDVLRAWGINVVGPTESTPPPA